MKIVKTFILGILAGASISLGGILFVVAKSFVSPILGGFLFSVGLLLVCTLKFNLFTGKIGYIFNNKKSYVLDLAIMYLGNLLAAVSIGYLIRFIGGDFLKTSVEKIASSKLNKSWSELLASGFFCGIFVYLAVDVFKSKKIWIGLRVIWLILCIAAFVILGFDHCIANMFYFGFANAYGTNILGSIISLLIVTVANSLGAIFVNCIKCLNLKK